MARQRNRLTSNLLTASLTFALPLCVLAGLVFRDLSRDIDSAERERLGVVYMDRLSQLLRLYADPRSEGRPDERAQIHGEIEAAFDALVAVDTEMGERLQTTADALKQHGRAHYQVAHLREEWNERERTGAHHVDHLLEDVRSLMRHVSNSSGLSLDPELDTYYLMTLSCDTLPDALARMHYLGEFTRFDERLDRRLRERLKMLSWLLVGEHDRIAYAVSVASDPLSSSRGDPNATGEALRQPHQRLDHAIDSLRGAARELRRTQGSDGAVSAAYERAFSSAMNAMLSLSTGGSQELDRLLAARIQSQRRSRSAAVVLALASFAATALLLRRVLQDVRKQLGDAGRVAREIGAGNLAVAFDPDATSEARQLMTHLDAMADELSTMVQQAVSLVDRVASTTREMARRSVEIDARLARQDEAIAQTTSAVERVAAQAAHIASLSERLGESTDSSAGAAMDLAAGANQLSESAESLFASVSEVSSAIQQQATGLERVVASTESVHDAAERTSAYMVQLQQRVANTESAAKDSTKLAERSKAVAASGQVAVERTLSGMSEIQERSQELEANLERLAERSRAIGQVTTMIDLIADDTSLLAFNAAVIAAQSGGQSRAFRVVADEIKALSRRVLERTREIEVLVRALQGETTAAVGVLERSREAVAKGMARTSDTRATFDTIAEAARESSAQSAEIVAAVDEQRGVVVAVAEQMASVRDGVEAIRGAAGEQHNSNELLVRGAQRVHDVSAQLQSTAHEQAKGASDVQASVGRIRGVVASIETSLGEQNAGCERARASIAQTAESARATRGDVAAMNDTVQALLAEAEQLRAHVKRFTLRANEGAAR